jgi:ParB-like chromosome segregation protein Spo0J
MSFDNISLTNPSLKNLDIPPALFQAEVTPGGVKAIKSSAKRSDAFIMQAPADLVVVSDLNTRIKTPALAERIRVLADDMKARGFRIDRPISCYVERRDGADRVIIVDGHTRLSAVLLAIEEGADIESVPVCLLPKSTNMDDILVSLVVANAGEKLTMLETSIVVKRLQARGSMEDGEIANKLGVTTTQIDNLSILAAAPKAVHQMVAANQVAASTVIELIKKVGVEKAVAQLKEQLAAATANGKTNGKITPKSLPSMKFASALKRSAPRLFEHASNIRKDPAYGQLSAGTRENLEALLAELEADMPAE